MKRLLTATVAVLALGAFTTPALADKGGFRGGPDGQGTPAEVGSKGRAGDAASHDNAHGTNANASDRAGRNFGGRMNGVGNEDVGFGGGGAAGSQR